jgi:hypothetical protein
LIAEVVSRLWTLWWSTDEAEEFQMMGTKDLYFLFLRGTACTMVLDVSPDILSLHDQ